MLMYFQSKIVGTMSFTKSAQTFFSFPAGWSFSWLGRSPATCPPSRAACPVAPPPPPSASPHSSSLGAGGTYHCACAATAAPAAACLAAFLFFPWPEKVQVPRVRSIVNTLSLGAPTSPVRWKSRGAFIRAAISFRSWSGFLSVSVRGRGAEEEGEEEEEECSRRRQESGGLVSS